MTLIRLLACTVLLVLVPQYVMAQTNEPETKPTGLWTNQKQTVVVDIEQCRDDGSLCGRVVWLKKPYDKDGNLKRDHYNPKPEQRDRGLCDLEILSGFSYIGGNRWENGRIYNPEEGQTYRASLELISEDEIRLRGYVLLPVFGKTQVWERLSAVPGECPGQAESVPALAERQDP
jgi:uncharacterized protein (DUF2147 family)